MYSRRARLNCAGAARQRAGSSFVAALAIASCGPQVDVVAYGSAGSRASGGAPNALAGREGALSGGSVNGGAAGEGEPPRAGDAGAASGGAYAAASGGVSGGTSGETPVGCVDGYPRIAWASPSGVLRSRCVAGFARDRMNHALCSRGPLDTPGRVYADAFDSAIGRSAPGAAAVGVNGDYLGQLSPIIFGGFTVASRSLLLLPGLDVHGDLRLGGSLRTSGPIYVARDAWFAESVVSLTSARVGRDVHLAPGKILDGIFNEDVGGRLTREAFDVPLPCGSASDVLDIAGIIASAAVENENATIGLDGAALREPPQAVDLRLPCGRFFLSAIGGNRDIRLRVASRAALFVAGDIASSGRLDVSLAPGAELDWFIGGNLALGNGGILGNAGAPAALRIYVAGGGPISVPRDFVFGNLYAPNADLTLSGSGDFQGSIFAAKVTSLANIIIHYDSAVQQVASGCLEQAPSACGGCAECPAGETCRQGRCAPCSSDGDCCAPMVCNDGSCSAFAE